MKKPLVFIGLGLAGCFSAILYAWLFSQTGSQRVFAAVYFGSVLLTASAASNLVFVAFKRKMKVLSVLSSLATFGAVVVLLISPFYVLH